MRTRQRGYNLVEIAIVLVVILMMSSFLAVNYFNVEKTRRNQQVERQIEQIKAAVIDYAAGHHTAGRFVVNAGAAVTVRWMVPAGRPYLPCPDITGDGREDRISVVVTPVLTINTAAGEYPLETTGGCYSHRGVVPWRTLGTAAADPWGNRYTYRVDAAFAGALTGFDQHTHADSSYKSRPLTVVAGMTVAQTFTAAEVRPRVIPTTLASWGTLEENRGPAIVCRQAPCPAAAGAAGLAPITVAPVAGVLLTTATPANIYRPHFADSGGAVVLTLNQIGQVTDGIPFVVVSHGANQYGGVRAGGNEGYQCVPFPAGASREDEKQNAFWDADTNSGAVGSAQYNCADVIPAGGAENGFVDGINHGTRVDESQEGGYDDLVGWVSVDELMFGLNRRRVLPVRLLPPVGLE